MKVDSQPFIIKLYVIVTFASLHDNFRGNLRPLSNSPVIVELELNQKYEQIAILSDKSIRFYKLRVNQN